MKIVCRIEFIAVFTSLYTYFQVYSNRIFQLLTKQFYILLFKIFNSHFKSLKHDVPLSKFTKSLYRLNHASFLLGCATKS